MFRIAFKHLFYEACINVMFDKIIERFSMCNNSEIINRDQVNYLLCRAHLAIHHKNPGYNSIIHPYNKLNTIFNAYGGIEYYFIEWEDVLYFYKSLKKQMSRIEG